MIKERANQVDKSRASLFEETERCQERKGGKRRHMYVTFCWLVGAIIANVIHLSQDSVLFLLDPRAFLCLRVDLHLVLFFVVDTRRGPQVRQ